MHPLLLNGQAFPNIHVISIRRSFTVMDGPNAGRVMTGAMERDIIGTFYNYTVAVDADDADRAEYDAFYELISAPVDSHEITIPYAQSVLTFRAYVTGGQDDLLTMYGGNEWGGLSINFTAQAPQRRPAGDTE